MNAHTIHRPVWLVVVTLLLALSGHPLRGDGPPAARLRAPAALAISPDGDRLFVANSRSGSLSVVDLRSQRVVAEHDVGRGLADLSMLPDGRHLLAIDRGANVLLLLEERSGSIVIGGRQAIAPEPAFLLVARNGHSCVVASPWSRKLTFIELSRTESGSPRFGNCRVLVLPFSPRNMVFLAEGSWLLVADAFGGGLAVVDPRRVTLESVRNLPAHNIRGLAVSPDGRQAVLAHQVLHRLARTSFEDVHWGSLLSNELRVLKVDRVLAPVPGADWLRDSRQFDLGDPGNGSGDPDIVAFTPAGQLMVAVAGVDQIRIGPDAGRLPIRTGVGRRPTAIAIHPSGLTAYVANTLEDTVSVLDISSGLVRATVSLGPRPELSAAERGERLYFDARLAHDGWMSCQSCHTDGHSNSRAVDTLGDGDFGAPKRVPSLLGVGTTGPWGWLGGFARLEDQVRQSLQSTMQGTEPTAAVVSDLVAYLRSLAPPRPAPGPSESPEAARGRAVFRAQGCAECHASPEYTTPQVYDVHLADETGHRLFNPPSLRSVGQRAPLLHDGRAATLEEVFRVHRHPRELVLSPAEIADLLAFLETL